MSQHKIMIASVLKPVKDTRVYYRFGLSLRETNKYQINIIGFSSKKERDEKNISFYPIFTKKRNHVSRYFAGLKLIRQIIKVKPKIIILSAWELLPAGVIGKILFGGKLIYDVQENHISNIQYNRSMPLWKKAFAKGMVGFFEALTKPFISYFLLAEQCYVSELPSFSPYLVLENKFHGNPVEIIKPVGLNKDNVRFLISGTITEVFGIVDAIEWFKVIHQAHPSYHLYIIGHCPLPLYKEKIVRACEGIEAISLRLSEKAVPYSEIMEAYTQSDVILMPYHQLPSIKDKIPSKLYESLALGKPYLISPNAKWQALTEKYNSGLSIDFKELENAPKNLESFLKGTYFLNHPGDEVLWKSDEGKFLELMEMLTSTE
jgi:glycosyltransferase involved in cell wall biosynthesis